VRGIARTPFSALTGKGVDKLMRTVLAAYDVWNRRVPTARLNDWLARMVARHPPPLADGRAVKIRYMTQTGARPPTFALFINKPAALPAAYRRYLLNDLRDSFGLPGTPVRLMLRAGRNPYEKGARKGARTSPRPRRERARR